MTSEIPLGQASTYPDQYSPDLLYAIARTDSREVLGLKAELPFHGIDVWNAWELSWLDPNGLPHVASAQISVPADSTNIVESKSLKLYLGSFAMSQHNTELEVADIIASDLTACVEAKVDVALRLPNQPQYSTVGELPGACIDDRPVRCDGYAVAPELLMTDDSAAIDEKLHSHLLRSLCPVTGQPDIGSVMVSYHGPRIDRDGLLRYIVSYRLHQDFHEACVERMFSDIRERCRSERLTVYARYQRRGGIDINPFRSNFEHDVPNDRLWRQ